MKIKIVAALSVLLCTAAVALAQSPTPLLTQPADKLIAVLKSDANRKEKADACRELAVLGDPRAVSVLAGMLADEEMSHMARYALEAIPSPSVDTALRDQLPKLKGRYLAGVIGSLGVRKDAKAVKPLAKLLSDTDPQVAQAAARALGRIGTTSAAQAIQAALVSTAPPNRVAFYEGLFRYADAQAAQGNAKPALAVYDKLRRTTGLPQQMRVAAVRGAILVRGKGDLSLLKECLASGDYLLFSSAVRAAVEMHGPEVTRVLVNSLPQLGSDNQIVVMKELGHRGEDGVIPALYKVSKNGQPAARVAALRAIASIGKSASVPVMVELIGDADREVTQAAKDGLAGIPGPEADAAALEMLKSGGIERRLTGIELVGRRQMASAIPALLKLAADSEAKVRTAAFQRLGELGGPGEATPLINLLLAANQSGDLDAASEALSNLSTRAGKPDSVTDQAISALSKAQPGQKGALLGVLRSIGGTKSLDAVRAAVADANAEVRDAGVRALADWPEAAAAPDLLQVVKSSSDNAQRVLAFRGYMRLTRERGGSPEEKLKLLSEAATVASNADEKKLVLAALADINSTDSLRLVVPYLADQALADEAGAAAVRIANRLDSKCRGEIEPALNQVLQSAKSEPVLEQARARLARFVKEEEEFKSLFNGKDLTGWAGRPNHWSVEDGAITGQTTKEDPAKGNNFLIAKDGDKDLIVGDFELRLSFKFSSDWGNSGVQYRSKNMGNFVVHGYQADMETGPTYTGILYEEGGRGILAQRGQKVTISDNPDKPGQTKIVVTGSLGDGKKLQEAIKDKDWNDYVIIARGNHLEHFVNGKQTVEIIDQQESKCSPSGILALQLHAGQPMKIQFKNIRIKSLK